MTSQSKSTAGKLKQENRMPTASLTQDKNDPSQYRVECILEDGGVEVAIFAGPNAKERAINFVSEESRYYEDWADPQGLAGY